MDNSKLLVLIADGDRAHGLSLKSGLTSAGFKTVLAEDPTRCQVMLKSREFDALIIDVLLCNNMELDLITWSRSKWSMLRIVAMSDFASSYLERESLAKGANRFMKKPVNTGELAEYLSPADTSDAFSGNLEGIDIIEYLQFMLLTGKKTVMEISSVSGDVGRIYLSDGDVRHAVCGDMQGERALYHCLGFKGGRFSNLRWSEPESVTINKPGEFLLIEASRLRDEARRGDKRRGT